MDSAAAAAKAIVPFGRVEGTETGSEVLRDRAESLRWDVPRMHADEVREPLEIGAVEREQMSHAMEFELIEEKAKALFQILFDPEVNTPIKTLDLPLGGVAGVRSIVAADRFPSYLGAKSGR